MEYLISTKERSKRWWSKITNIFLYSNRRCTMNFIRCLTLIVLILILWVFSYFDLKDYENLPNDELALNIYLTDDNNNSSCYCNNENFCFQGLNENGSVINGRKFDCSLYEGLKLNGLLDTDALNTPSDYKTLNDSWRPVFVTSMSDNHFRESRKLVKSINKYYPHSKIVVFDLGLRLEYKNELKSWCNIEYKKFWFKNYPYHVKNLKTAAFKLAIIEAIQTYKAFFYIDSSIRFTHNNMLYFLDRVKSNTLLPFSMPIFKNYSVFSTTHKRMFDYLPLPKIITQMDQMQNTIMFISDSSYTRYVLKWFYLCAMTKNCIVPIGSNLECDLNKYYDLKRTYTNCHKFDQSFWSIATLAYLFGENRGALEMGYVNKNWSALTEDLIVLAEKEQHLSMSIFSQIITIKHGDKMEEKLELKCGEGSN